MIWGLTFGISYDNIINIRKRILRMYVICPVFIGLNEISILARQSRGLKILVSLVRFRFWALLFFCCFQNRYRHVGYLSWHKERKKLRLTFRRSYGSLLKVFHLKKFFMRVQFNGRTPAFQAGYVGSIPITRSLFLFGKSVNQQPDVCRRLLFYRLSFFFSETFSLCLIYANAVIRIRKLY